MLLIYTALGVSVSAVGLDIYKTVKDTKNFKGISQPDDTEELFFKIAQNLDNIKRSRLKYRWMKYKYKRNRYLMEYNYIKSVESLDTYLHTKLFRIHNEMQNYDNQIMTRKIARQYRKQIKTLMKGVEQGFRC